MDDSKIIELYNLRDQSAIHETDRKYGGMCRKISYNILASREDSEECAWDSYLECWKSIPPQRPNRLQAFVAAITRNLSLMRLRARTAKKRGGGEGALALEELGDCFASDFSVERHIEQREAAEAIESFLSTLSEENRRIFLCRYWLFAPTAEIAARLGCSQGKVLTALCRTRQKLGKFLTEEGLI